MYRCPECGAIFDEPKYETVCFEELYGVSSMFPDRHYGTFANCPECDSPIDIEEDAYDPDSQEGDSRVAYYERQGDEYVYYDENECEIYREPV